MGLTAAERKALFKQTLSGDDSKKDNSLISSGAIEEKPAIAKPKPVAAKKPKAKEQPTKAPKKEVKESKNSRIGELESFFAVSKQIREQVDEEFGSDENQLTFTTGLYPRYISILKRMSKSVGISQGAIVSAALCHMLAAFPEEERSAIIKDQVNEIW
ncbi:MAG: hypothetical protein JXR10_12765 [Cyclobacteriaceae bacterium]